MLIVDAAEQVAIARKLLAGKQAPQIPNGRIARGNGGVNQPWSWHIDPRDFEFADMTIELCDGLPSYVEDGTLTGDRFCPWSAKVVSCRSGALASGAWAPEKAPQNRTPEGARRAPVSCSLANRAGRLRSSVAPSGQTKLAGPARETQAHLSTKQFEFRQLFTKRPECRPQVVWKT